MFNSVCFQHAKDDGLNHAANFIIADSRTIEAGEWYGLDSFSSIFSVPHIVISK